MLCHSRSRTFLLSQFLYAVVCFAKGAVDEFTCHLQIHWQMFVVPLDWQLVSELVSCKQRD